MNIEKELALARGQELLPMSYGRPSVLNGSRDFTAWGEKLEQHKEKIIKHLNPIYGDDAEAVYKLALAEHLYQRDECFEALVQVVSTIPMMEKKRDVHCLLVALTLEMTILVISGQASSTMPLMKALRERVAAAGRTDELIKSIDALEVWASMYDGQTEEVNRWMKQGAPDENTSLRLEEMYCYLIKLRCYLVQEKHMALIVLAERLKSGISFKERPMDWCEITMLMSMACYEQGLAEQAFYHMDEVLEIAENYRYDRLIGDEGRRMYRLLYDYRRERGRTAYLDRVLEIARKTGLLYPDYLKSVYQEVKSLSDTEKRVLNLMKEQMSNEEIAEYLDITVNTVKFHSKNIFRKLDVHSRHTAVKRAREVGIL